ncbi:hypothetical protein [Streptomyces sp. A1136]|uniref:hypothetical protein n=1 Tax=Streptomyces sp. A1136 TaxID=2563102 RepID=UPI0019D065EE|nr:hypothetical protein [Streptomyces sp. A1136]
MRIHGDGGAVFRDDPRWAELIGLFGEAGGPAARAIVVVRARRIADVCGHAVPLMEYQGERTLHQEHFRRKTDEEFAEYCEKKDFIETSLDGLPALPLPLPPRTV